jgi:hypothetical protein
MSARFLIAVAVISLCGAAGCSRGADIEKVPIGSDVQVTREDGGVVEGKLAERDEKTVTVKAGRSTRTVARPDIADVQVVTPENPPELPPVAKFREVELPAGTPLRLTLETPVSSETSKVGDAVEARLASAVRVDDSEVLPEGSVVRGTVTAAKSAGKVKGRASLAMRFTTAVVRDERYPISAGIAVEARSTKGKDAATIAIPAVGGAIIGGILGGDKGAATGAAIGGGAGTAIVLATEGKPIEFGRGATLNVTLADPVEIRVPVR